MVRIQGKKCIVRQWRAEDVDAVAKYADNPGIARNMRDGFPQPYNRVDAEVFVTMAMHNPNASFLAVEVDGEAVGSIGYVPKTDVERVSAEVGYWLAEPYWGRGIVTDALQVMADYIFTHTDILNLYAKIFEYNTASMRVLEKAGFEKRAILRKAAIKNDRVIDLHYYERVKEE